MMILQTICDKAVRIDRKTPPKGRGKGKTKKGRGGNLETECGFSTIDDVEG